MWQPLPPRVQEHERMRTRPRAANGASSRIQSQYVHEKPMASYTTSLNSSRKAKIRKVDRKGTANYVWNHVLTRSNIEELSRSKHRSLSDSNDWSLAHTDGEAPVAVGSLRLLGFILSRFSMKSAIFRRKFDDNFPEFRRNCQEMTKCLEILRKSVRKIRKKLEISRICEKFSFFISSFHSSP